MLDENRRVSPSRHESAREGAKTGPFRVALAFDDGYLEHYRTAELLNHHGVKGTYFIVTGLRRWNNRPLLTTRPSLIQSMKRMGHEIASHTVSHPRLQQLTNEEVHRELRDSKRYLTSLLENDVEGFAYPYGDYEGRIARIASQYYSYARAAREVETPNRYELPIRNPGLSLRRSCFLMTRSLIKGEGDAILLIHRIDLLSLKVCLAYLKLFRVQFVTVSELVQAKYGRRESTQWSQTA